MTAQAHDWLDHVWGWSQFGGAILALVALVFAAWSVKQARRAAKDSTRSAAAAEKTAAAAQETANHSREEVEILRAEAARRPELEFVEVEAHPIPGDPLSVVVRIRARNRGSRAASRVGLNVYFPRGVEVRQASNRTASDTWVLPSDESGPPEQFRDDPALEWRKAILVIAELGIMLPELIFIRFRADVAGAYPAVLLLAHGEAPQAAYAQLDLRLGEPD